MDKQERLDKVALLQREYAEFRVFLYDVMTNLLGFECSDIQLDIADFLAGTCEHRMVQAQRGQAKTTITACYAVWKLIHAPRTRVLIISAGSDVATEIANWVIQIIMHMPILACLRPDRTSGDRASVKSFDLHFDLRGTEKSPSVACIGITGSLQGRRADLLIADDIESKKNSSTDVQRSILENLTKDFTSICSNGEIVYLGTPQSVNSIYNNLYSRGYTIRIWPGRYPTEEEENNYGVHLAPLIKQRVNLDPSLRTGGGPTGTRGQATDPLLISEQKLTEKEIDQGPAYFQLQYMLDTKLADSARFPLKINHLIFMRVPKKSIPVEINFYRGSQDSIKLPDGFPARTENYFRASSFSDLTEDITAKHMYIDPAGGGKHGDETAYAVTTSVGGKIFVLAVGSVPGGLEKEKLDKLIAAVNKYKPNIIHIEKNFGNGALSSVLTPLLLKDNSCRIEDVWETGQKELRIIDTLEPIISSNRLVVDEEIIYTDFDSVQNYPLQTRNTYSLFVQLSRITRDKKSLRHDDKLDALAGSVRYWLNHLKQDSDTLAEQAKTAAYLKMIENPLGYADPNFPSQSLASDYSAIDTFKNKFN